MRHGSSSRRQRSRNSGRRNNNQQRTQVFDSNGPDVRIRGTAHQVAEKYLTLAKDANCAGDIIIAENYYQHAEHYIRVIGENNGKFDTAKGLGKKAAHDGTGNRNMRAQKPKAPADDLALPSSILGQPSKKVAVQGKEVEAVS